MKIALTYLLCDCFDFVSIHCLVVHLVVSVSVSICPVLAVNFESLHLFGKQARFRIPRSGSSIKFKR